MTDKNIFDRLAEQTKKEEAEATQQAADVETLEQLFAWLYEYLSKVDVRRFNSVLVDYAEHILDDPENYGDAEWNYQVKGSFSFLGLVLRETGKSTKTRPYSAALMELAGSIHANPGIESPPEYELACGMAFDLADLKDSGLFRFKRKGGSTCLLGTKKLKRKYGVTANVHIEPDNWYDIE